MARRKTTKKKRKHSRKKKHSLYKFFRADRYGDLYVAAAVMVVVLLCVFFLPASRRWRTCPGHKAYGVCMPKNFEVHGLDLSHHQGHVDWSKLRLTGSGQFPLRFVFIKATEGGDFADKNYSSNLDSARAAGFMVGAYHFYNPATPPERQAEFFIKNARLKAGDLPPVLDIERKVRDRRGMCDDLMVWLDIVEKHYGVKPVIYASYKYRTSYLDKRFDDYPYWIAHYYVSRVKYEGRWMFWQHTDRGTLPGVDEYVDLNVFNGSPEQLQEMAIR